ncbi:MAG: GlcNAc-PI de-N-acetylase [Rickettsiales bacterium]|nr:GlcNAc-PI de-N-acetylase [Rickettsiales bacterium]
MMKKNALIICSHPDDEVLGCGGTIDSLSKKYNFFCVHLTKGEAKRTEKDLSKKLIETKKAKKILGIKKIFNADFPDNALDSIKLIEIIQYIENIISKIKPELIFTHSPKDLNIDHKICNQATITACRPIKKTGFIKKILCFEILSSSEWNFVSENFNPNIFVKISKKNLKKKIEAMKSYSTELRKFPHPRSLNNIKNLAMNRGSTISTEYAEAFELGFERM